MVVNNDNIVRFLIKAVVQAAINNKYLKLEKSSFFILY